MILSATQRETFFKALQRAYPHPVCELNWTNEFTLMVAIILSAQSTDKMVNRVTPALFELADTPQKMVDLGVEKITQLVSSINYFNNKTRSILGLSAVLLEKYGGKMPTDFETLLTLPGVGRKTANVFLNVAYHEPRIGIDTHVLRLINRLKLGVAKNPEEAEKIMMDIVPDWYKADVALALVLHGRYVCTAKKPKCPTCPLKDVCFADEKMPL